MTEAARPAPDGERRAELAGALADVRRRVHDACATAGRGDAEVTLIGITKTFPVSDAYALAGLGVADLGESRDQEARVKAAQFEQWGMAEVRWHFVGRLQTNKCRSVARYAAAVHAVDRAEVVDALAAGVARLERAPLEVFVQLSLDGDPSRAGVPGADLPALADRVDAAAQLRLAGTMAIAPLGADPDAAFARLAELSLRLRDDHPEATAMSAGMSGDLAAAVAHGATHVRVGTALLGHRPADSHRTEPA